MQATNSEIRIRMNFTAAEQFTAQNTDKI